jgi:hypothetical protein
MAFRKTVNGMALGQLLSLSLSSNEHFAAPATRSPTSRPSASLSKNLNYLLSAAVVSPRFRCLLLSDPVAALAAGYNGEKFQLTPAEYAAVTSLRVSTVRDFAAQLLRVLQCASEDAALYDTKPQSDLHFAEMATQSLDSTDEKPALLSRKQEADNSHSRHSAPSRHVRRSVAASDGHRGGHSAQGYGS